VALQPPSKAFRAAETGVIDVLGSAFGCVLEDFLGCRIDDLERATTCWSLPLAVDVKLVPHGVSPGLKIVLGGEPREPSRRVYTSRRCSPSGGDNSDDEGQLAGTPILALVARLAPKDPNPPTRH
jgi:hypothetical protein